MTNEQLQAILSMTPEQLAAIGQAAPAPASMGLPRQAAPVPASRDLPSLNDSRFKNGGRTPPFPRIGTAGTSYQLAPTGLKYHAKEYPEGRSGYILSVEVLRSGREGLVPVGSRWSFFYPTAEGRALAPAMNELNESLCAIYGRSLAEANCDVLRDQLIADTAAERLSGLSYWVDAVEVVDRKGRVDSDGKPRVYTNFRPRATPSV